MEMPYDSFPFSEKFEIMSEISLEEFKQWIDSSISFARLNECDLMIISRAFGILSPKKDKVIGVDFKIENEVIESIEVKMYYNNKNDPGVPNELFHNESFQFEVIARDFEDLVKSL